MRPVRRACFGEPPQRMGAGVPSVLRRSREATVVALAAACWLAAPAHAVNLPADVPAAAPVAPSMQVPAPPPPSPDLTPAAAPLQATAGDASSSVERVVAAAADTLAGGAEPAVEAATRAVPAASSPPATSRPHAVRDRPSASASGVARRASGRPAKRHSHDRHAARPATNPDAASTQALPSAPRGSHSTTAHSAAASPSAAPAADTAPQPPFSLDPPVSGGSASGVSTGLPFGGLAVLLTALLLAGPALRHRLPSRPALCWPAAFVPLLERPG